MGTQMSAMGQERTSADLDSMFAFGESYLQRIRDHDLGMAGKASAPASSRRMVNARALKLGGF